MKRMLDELKNLDEEYTVPQDFRKKVMVKIKEEQINEKKHFNKYVISWMSTAAVVVIAVVASIGGARNKSADSCSIGMMDTECAQNNSIASNVSTESEAYRGTIESMNNSNVPNSALKLDSNGISYEVDNSIGMDLNSKDSINMNVENSYEINVINDRLIKNKIEILKKNEDYLIVNSTFNEVQKVLSGEEYRLEEINENRIKINF